MQLKSADVPLDVRRLAARHLESLRGTEIMAGAEDAHLAEWVTPIYRPDLQPIAYYEFAVLGHQGQTGRVLYTPGFQTSRAAGVSGAAGRKAAAKEAGPGRPALASRAIGFVVVSNGRHDFPVTHWSLDRLPPSTQLARVPACEGTETTSTQGTAARIYKLDTLAYAAEDAEGRLVAQTGQLPGIISGLPHSLEAAQGQIASAMARPLRAREDDRDVAESKHEVERHDAEAPPLTRTDNGGWKALKARYGDAFGPFLDHLAKRAARTWELEDLVRKLGEGILAGTTHRVALLADAAIEVSGEGATYITASVEENRAGPPALLLRAASVSLQREAEFDVALRYAGGEQERLMFFVVSPQVPSNRKGERSRRQGADCEE